MFYKNESKFIRRDFYCKRMTNIEGSQYDATNNIKNQVVISVDCTSIKKIVEVTDIKVRQLDDIVSQQFLIGYNGKILYYVLTRNQGDTPFDFWDISMVVKDFLQQIGYKEKYSTTDYSKLAAKFKMKTADVRKYSGKLKIPRIIMVGYLLGDTVTAYKNWQTYITTTDKSKDKTVTVYQDALTSYHYLPVCVPSPDYQRRTFLEVKLCDNIALSSAQDGLEELAKMFNVKLTELDDYTNYSDLLKIVRNTPSVLLGSVMINYQYLGFVASQTREINDDGLTGKFQLPSRLSELGDRISDHFFQKPYDNKQTRKVIKSVFCKDSIEKYLKPRSYNQLPPKDEVDKWNKLIKNIKNDSQRQTQLLRVLESYLARNSIRCQINSKGEIYWFFKKKNILNQIDFDSLYKNNPDLDIEKLLDEKTTSLVPQKYNPIITNTLKRYYRKNKRRFKRGYYSNEPESLESLLKQLWVSSTFGSVCEKADGKTIIVSNNVNHFFSQHLDYKYIRNGCYFLVPNKLNGSSKSHHDMNTVRINQATNRGFKIACQAFKGGLNQAYDHGVINEYKYIYSPDLKSSYPMAGSFIPDFHTDVEPLIDQSDISLKEFNRQVRPRLVNGDFTLGVCICTYEFPNGIKRIPVGVRSDMENDSPHYVKRAEHVCMTVTDAINVIEHGVSSMQFERIIVPVQKKLDCTEESLSPVSRAQHWGLRQRELARKMYGDESPEQSMFKSFVNVQYGKSGQGLLPKGNNGHYKYINFSRSTNPYIAAQFTSITRYLVCALADAFEQAYPGSLIPSITTDGMCLCTNEKVDKQKVTNILREKHPMWAAVVDKWFNGTFFKFKSKLPLDDKKVSIGVPLVVVKNRFEFTPDDGRINAMVGITNGDINKIYDCLKQGQASFATESVRKSGLGQLKQRINLKYLQSEWKQTVYQNLGYDDFNRVVGFHETKDGLVHYETEPFDTVEELLATKRDLKPYRRLFPLLKVEYAKAFMNLDNTLVQTNQDLKIKWVKDDVLLKNLSYKDLFEYYQNRYLPKVLLRYLAQNKKKLNLKAIYQNEFCNHYSTYSGFKQAVNRSDGKFVNPFAVLKENWNIKFKKYQLNR